MKLLERNKLRIILNENGVNTRNMSDDEMTAAHANIMKALGAPEAKAEALPQKPAREHAPKEKAAPQAKKAAPKLAAVPAADEDTVKKIADLIEGLRPAQEASAIDEAAIIALIEKHAKKTTVVEVKQAGETIAIEGAHKSLEQVVKVLSVGVMPYLCGPAGSGKTTLAIQAAEALDLEFYSTGAVNAPYELLGHFDANGNYQRTALREAFEDGGVMLFDEIDGCSAKALVAVNQLLANDRFTFPDGVIEKHEDFRGIAAANTTGHGATREYIGRNPLDGATLDRFVMLDVAYDEALELQAALNSYAAHGGQDEQLAVNWVAHVLRCRAAALACGIKIIISPRASIQGAKLLTAGFTTVQLTDMIIFKGASKDTIKQILAAIK